MFAAIWIAPPPLKKVILRLCCDADIAATARIGWFSAVAARRVVLGEHSVIRPLSLVRCDEECRLGDYAEVSSFVLAYGAASLVLGRHAYVGPQCLLNADEPIRIGAMSALGPRCMVFTHGSFLPVSEGYPARLAGVTIGDRAWLAAGVFVHPGVAVGDDVLVNSRAVVTQDLASGSVAEGNPARAVATMDRVRRRMTPARVDAAMRDALRRFADVVLRGTFAVAVEGDASEGLRFTWEGRAYLVRLLAGAAPARDAVAAEAPGTRAIVLDAREEASRHAGDDPIVLHVPALRTPYPRDHVHRELVEFLRRYYGMHFEFDVPSPS